MSHVIFPEYTTDKAFEAFYRENYKSLPEWVNDAQFKTSIKERFLVSITESRQHGDSTFPGGSLLHPLISARIDIGGYNTIDNYGFYFENPEQMINSWTGLIGDQTTIMEFGYDSDKQTQIEKLLEEENLVSKFVDSRLYIMGCPDDLEEYVQDLSDDHNIQLNAL